ncbi:ABC transporter permease [Propionicicella superfundia]|uniref:ABC transporter permease n=1 Tax=Propionicicella superfundia TaxID=348582 RepID=UPI000415ED12|nr:ABC transporter permease [Propionicicella superfundia]
MLSFTLRRVALFVGGLFVTTIVVFVVLRVLPGDVAQVIGGIKATPEQIEQIRSEYGLDQPLVVQYVAWLGGLLRFDLGTSLITHTPIGAEIAEKLSVTLPLCVAGIAVALVIGVPLGVYGALRHRTTAGRVVAYVAQAAAAVPVLWTGLILILLLGRGVGAVSLLPTQGFPKDGWADPAAALASIALPALTIGIVEGAVVLRYMRSAVLNEMNLDYIRTAMSRGLTRTGAVLRHGVPNASISVLSVVGLQTASLVGGAVVIEELFALPGLGAKLVSDVGNRDLLSVQGIMVVLTGLVLAIGLVVDLAHRVIDPRQRRVEA